MAEYKSSGKEAAFAEKTGLGKDAAKEKAAALKAKVGCSWMNLNTHCLSLTHKHSIQP